MAVVRITAPKRWHLRAAQALQDYPRAAREFGRAAERRGLSAELRADEMRALAELWPKDERVQKALGELQAAEDHEATRPRARDIALGLHRESRI